jgi:hypothetical protein
MRKLLLTLLLTAACASFGYAQSSPDERDKVNVFVGFSHNRVDTGGGDGDLVNDREGFNGVNGSITGNVSRYVGLKFDYSYHSKEFSRTHDVICVTTPCPPTVFNADARIHNFLGGVQFKDNTKDSDKRLRPFGHVLVGVHNSSVTIPTEVCAFAGPTVCPDNVIDETGFAAAVGGGLDVRLSDRVSVRAIQLDWNPNRYGSDNKFGFGSDTSHNFRIGVGVVFH